MKRGIAWIAPQHPLELIGGHRSPCPLAPLGLGAGDELGAEALLEAASALDSILARTRSRWFQADLHGSAQHAAETCVNKAAPVRWSDA